MLLDRDDYPPGVPCWVDTSQPDITAAAAFYGALFAWEFEERTPDGQVEYLVARLGASAVAAVAPQPPGAAPEATWNTYVAVDSADDAVDRVVAAGGTVIAGPFDVHDAGRMAVIADPAGAVLYLWQAGRRKGAQLVNAPGSWNWSNLETSDPGGSKAFYGAVFGWEAEATQFGGSESAMLRLPGYGEFLAARDPELRRRHAAAGVPSGFSDAIGWIVAPADGASSPRWSVTFAVDDPDAIAAHAAQLGGGVVVEPYDVAPVRLAVLRDPQGAQFTISAYDPS
ncbi:MAG TPA: VOC family protein [Solirubrobacteraceae bacterium]|jgi:predicted enzyme related to lactoylglutathione lyase|nr:VOC family protein [Solirubrobacteraceae bacterium]